jgi:hypothetical protein
MGSPLHVPPFRPKVNLSHKTYNNCQGVRKSSLLHSIKPTFANILSSAMQDKRTIVLVSLALLVASTLADVTSREKWDRWLRWGIDDCNGDPYCLNELVSYDYTETFCENDLSPIIIIFRNQPYEDSFCEFIPKSPRISECVQTDQGPAAYT